jgi:diguanylate cyclase (GGDEF)-like protein
MSAKLASHSLLALYRAVLMLLLLSATSVNADPAATQLEHQLEQYLELSAKDPKQAKLLLEQLEQKVTADTPLGLQVRVMVYQAGELAQQQKFTAAEQKLAQLLSIANDSQDANIKAEIMAEHLQQYWNRAEINKAISFLAPTEEYAAKANQSRVRYYAYHTAGRFQMWQGRFADALSSFYQAQESIRLDPSPRTPFRQMFIAGNIASLQASLRNYDAALNTLEQSITQALENPALRSYLPITYQQQGFILVEKKQLDEAIVANQKGLEWAAKLKDSYTEAVLRNNLGDIYIRQRKPELAEPHFQHYLRLGEQLQSLQDQILAKFNLGFVKVLQGNAQEGLQQMRSMLDEQKKIASQTEVLALMEEMADASRFAGDFQAEANFLREYNTLSKQLYQTERDRQLNQLQEEFSAQQKNREIAALKQQNQLKAVEIQKQQLQQQVTLLIGVVVLMASLLLYLLYRKVRTANLKLKAVNDQLAYQSQHDVLTGLLNRRCLLELMEKRQLQQERRSLPNGQTDAFILLDVDFFKHVNDHYGHAAGDAVLIDIARRLKALTRSEDLVLRWGGEEFLILLRRVDITAATVFTQRVLDDIGNNPVLVADLPIHVTVSAGFLTFPFAELDEAVMGWNKALQLADMALYLSKVHGRNRGYGLVKLHQPYHKIAQQLETDLSLAIEQGQVEVALVEGPTRRAE